MKAVKTGIGAFVLLIVAQSCSAPAHRYEDLNTGTAFELVKHPQTGLMVDAQTGKPLNIYVDRATNDTIDGRTGKIINGKVQKIDASFYLYDESREVIPVLASGGDIAAIPQLP